MTPSSEEATVLPWPSAGTMSKSRVVSIRVLTAQAAKAVSNSALPEPASQVQPEPLMKASIVSVSGGLRRSRKL